MMGHIHVRNIWSDKYLLSSILVPANGLLVNTILFGYVLSLFFQDFPLLVAELEK